MGARLRTFVSILVPLLIDPSARLVSARQAVANGYQQDFQVLVDTLKARHPGIPEQPLQMMPPDELERSRRVVHERLARVTTTSGFYFEVMGFLSRLHDGHANLSFSLRDQRVLPIMAHWFGDRVYILEVAAPAYAALRHAELRSVGGVSVLALEQRIGALLSTDLGAPRRHRKAQFGSSFFMTVEAFLVHVGVARGDAVEVVYVAGGRDHVIHLPFVTMAPGAGPAYSPYVRSAITRHSGRHTVQTLDDLATIYAQFSDLSSEVGPDFFVHLFTEARRARARFLVIDLRELSGGNTEPLLELFRYLIVGPRTLHLYRVWERSGDRNRLIFDGALAMQPAPEELRFSGRVVVFTGPNTFSAGTFPVVLAADNELATVIGEPCGNGSMRYGMVERMTLPHSGLTFQYSTRIWERSRPGANDPRRGIEPDVQVVPTFDDYRQQRDPVWDYFVQRYVRTARSPVRQRPCGSGGDVRPRAAALIREARPRAVPSGGPEWPEPAVP